jgi:hypothetical protein
LRHWESEHAGRLHSKEVQGLKGSKHLNSILNI